MDSAPGKTSGETITNKRRVYNLLLLFISALLVAAAVTASFWIADEYHIQAAWVFVAQGALVFFAVVGWGYRNKFGSPQFLMFFIAWLFVHVTIYILVLGYLGFLFYIPIVVLELWIGYALAISQFGHPETRRRNVRDISLD